MKNLILGLSVALFSVLAHAGEFNAGNLAGKYHLTHMLLKDKIIVLDLLPDQTFVVAVNHKGEMSEPCAGPYQIGSEYEYPSEGGSPVEVEKIFGTCHKEDKTADVVVYLKNVTPRSLQKGTHVTMDLNMDGKSMKNLSVRIKKQ